MESNLYQFVQAAMQATPRKEWRSIAELAGVPYGTAYRYAHGYVQRPTHDPLVKLASVLKGRGAQ